MFAGRYTSDGAGDRSSDIATRAVIMAGSAQPQVDQRERWWLSSAEERHPAPRNLDWHRNAFCLDVAPPSLPMGRALANHGRTPRAGCWAASCKRSRSALTAFASARLQCTCIATLFIAVFA